MADSTARIILSAEDRTAAALANVRNSLGNITRQAEALRVVLGGLVPAFSLVGVAAYVKSINDGVDALNDLKDATGASIENISALEDVAARTGTSFETVGTALIKLNQALNDAKPDSTQAAALKAIGLSADELKKIDPAEALRRTAVALSGFADDGNKARLVQELFGKSLREVAPLLKDLSEQGALVAKVTTEQAEEAEKFNKQLFELQKNAKDAARALTADLVKGLNEAAKAYREGGFIEGLQTLLTGNDEFKASKAFVEDYDKLLALESAIARARADGYKDGSRVLENLKAQKTQTEENLRLTQNYLKILRGDDKPQTDTKAAPQIKFDPDAEKKAAEAAKKLQEAIAKAQADITSAQIAELSGAAEAFVNTDFEATKAAADEQIKALSDAAKTELEQYFAFIDQQQEDAIREGQDLIRQSEEDAKRTRDIARDLGFTFSSAFEDAVVNGKEFSEVLKGIEQDILRIILRRQVTEPAAAAISNMDWGSIFGFADGGVMTGNGPLPLRTYAGGGVATSPQLAVFGEGSMNEAFVPLPDGRRIPVDLQGAGGGANVVVNVIESPGNGGQQSSRQEGGQTIIDVVVEKVKSAVAGDIMRGDGAVPAALGRTYGLNRVAGAY